MEPTSISPRSFGRSGPALLVALAVGLLASAATAQTAAPCADPRHRALDFLIGTWGSSNRIYAATKFVIYTFAGSILMLVAIAHQSLRSHPRKPTPAGGGNP